MSRNRWYQSAYAALAEWTLSVDNVRLLEAKAVADLITLKICGLCIPNESHLALEHFEHHIRTFGPRVGAIELDYYHHCWLAKQ